MPHPVGPDRTNQPSGFSANSLAAADGHALRLEVQRSGRSHLEVALETQDRAALGHLDTQRDSAAWVEYAKHADAYIVLDDQLLFSSQVERVCLALCHCAHALHGIRLLVNAVN